MPDSARIQTDKELAEMVAHLHKTYTDAQAELTAKWNKYMERGQTRLNNLYADYVSAPADKKAEALLRYQNAVQSYTLRNEWYQSMVTETAYRIAHVNEIAIAYINGKMPMIYATNFNYIDPELTKIGISWTIRDEHMIRNLFMDSIPQKKLDMTKDMAWNTRQINSSVLQGILQGESIPKIAKRLLPIVDNNEASSVRTARTMVTGAENRGRQDRYEEYESQGVEMMKVWIATPDGRTRDWHISMDGQEVPVNDVFIDGHGNELEYPGDDGAEPETVYNCFVANTTVATNSDVIRSYRHEYEGDLFTIKTAGGIDFTCTPNHPILTLRGWIAANALHKGDHILVTFGFNNRIFRFNPYIKHIFSTFDTIHKFFDESVTERACHLNVDFHGDRPTSDVEIVTQKRFLRDNGNPSSNKGIDEILLKSSNVPFPGKCTFVEHFRSIWFSSLCHIGGRCQSFAFFLRSLAHAKIHRIRPIAWGNSGRFKPIYNNTSGYSEILSECLNGFSGMVCADKIIDVDVKFSHCDVFNLQSENGYYYVDSSIPQKHKKNNGIMAIVQNCRCSMRSHLIGIRGADGKLTKFNTSDHSGSLHEKQMEAEKRRREEDG